MKLIKYSRKDSLEIDKHINSYPNKTFKEQKQQ